MDEHSPLDEPDDELLARAGLKPIRAYVRTEATKAAVRKMRFRSRREAAGTRQLNIEAPADEAARAALRALAAAMTAGTLPLAAVVPLTDAAALSAGAPLAADAMADELARVRRLLAVGGWRAWVVRRLARDVGAATS